MPGISRSGRVPKEDVRVRRALARLSVALADPGSGLTLTSQGLAVLRKSGGAIFVDANGLYVGLKTAGGILSDANGLYLDTVPTLAVYSAGTPYALTGTPALLTFGTTSPSLTLNRAGTWIIRARARIDRNNSTHLAAHNVFLNLRRTNNTAADLTHSAVAYADDPHNASSETEQFVPVEVVYTTANTNDVIELWGSVSAAGTGGTHDAVQAHIIAVFLR